MYNLKKNNSLVNTDKPTHSIPSSKGKIHCTNTILGQLIQPANIFPFLRDAVYPLIDSQFS